MALARWDTEDKLLDHFSFLPETSCKWFVKLPVQNLSREQWYKQATLQGKIILLVWKKVIAEKS